MLCVTNSTAANPAGSPTYANQPAEVGASNGALFFFAATGRGGNTAPGQSDGYPIEASTRTSSNTFMRGLREHIVIQTNDGTAWQWRRIVFFSRDIRFRANTTGSTTTFNPTYFNSNGYQRVVNQVVVGGNYDDIIWEGTQGVDWNSFINAKVDSKRLTVKYDKVITFNSGNQNGIVRNYRMYHPINKSLIYDDEEKGGDETISAWSVTDKRGCGDMYVVDLFIPGIGAASTSRLYFNPQATLYWHEK